MQRRRAQRFGDITALKLLDRGRSQVANPEFGRLLALKDDVESPAWPRPVPFRALRGHNGAERGGGRHMFSPQNAADMPPKPGRELKPADAWRFSSKSMIVVSQPDRASRSARVVNFRRFSGGRDQRGARASGELEVDEGLRSWTAGLGEKRHAAFGPLRETFAALGEALFHSRLPSRRPVGATGGPSWMNFFSRPVCSCLKPFNLCLDPFRFAVRQAEIDPAGGYLKRSRGARLAARSLLSA